MSKLVERAELLNYEELKATPVLRPKLLENLNGWLRGPGVNRLLILGPKGSGKTFLILKVLIDAVEADDKLKPGFITYKYAGAPMAVKVRRGCFLPEEDFWRLIESEELVVLDDIHYVCEDVARRKRSLRWLCTLLEQLESEADMGKRVVLVSEEPLSSYAELFDSEELRWIVEKVRRYQAVEILPPTPVEWDMLAKIYGVKLTPFVMKFIYFTSPRPRSFIRFCKMFGDVVSIPAFRKLALMRLETMRLVRRTYQRYREAIERPVTAGAEIADLLVRKPQLRGWLSDMVKLYDEVVFACNKLRRLIEERVSRKERKKYAKLENPATVIRKHWQKYKELPKYSYLRELVRIFWSHPELSGVHKLPTKEEFARKVNSGLKIVDSRLYLRAGRKMWLAVEPFREVFADVLYEPSTVEVVEELRKRTYRYAEVLAKGKRLVGLELELPLIEKIDKLAESLSTTRAATIKKAICEMLERHGEKVAWKAPRRYHDVHRLLAYALCREGLTYKAVAELMGIKESSAMSLVAQAKRRLREFIRRR